MPPIATPYATIAGTARRFGGDRQGRVSASSNSVAIARRKAAAPAAPTAGSRDLASAEPIWMLIIATSRTAMDVSAGRAGVWSAFLRISPGQDIIPPSPLRTINMHDPIAAWLAHHPLMILDGALATELGKRGADLKDPLWSAKLLIEAPDLIRAVHLDYFLAGADVATTATYQASFEAFAAR